MVQVGNLLSGAGEGLLGEGWEAQGGHGNYGSDLGPDGRRPMIQAQSPSTIKTTILEKVNSRFWATLVATTALTYTTETMASTCFDIAAQRYGKARVTLEAPYNYAQVIYAGRAPINCTIGSLHLGEYSLRISCQDGYKYEIGTTDYCGREGTPNCEKAIVTAPNGQRSYHAVAPLGEERICTKEGAELAISSKIFLESSDVLIITAHQLREQ